jgi:hypothetical protein
MITIFSYNRQPMLQRLVHELKEKLPDQRIVVIDDGSDFDPMPFVDHCEFHKLEHKGKEQWWKNWQYAFDICKESDDDFFAFMPDDWWDVWTDDMIKIHNDTSGAYAYNFHNNGIKHGWSNKEEKYVDIFHVETVLCHFVDCGYFCNRQALEAINFTQPQISMINFYKWNQSSGVGKYQTIEFEKNNVPMYRPVKSLSWTDRHPSMMHPKERELNPNLPIR